MKSRRDAREQAVQMLYSHEMTRVPVGDIIAQQLKDKNKQYREFTEMLVRQTVRLKERLDIIIQDKSHRWEIERIALLDRIILRLAICELQQFPDIPAKVTINEAIEIAKKYSTENSGKFINGILDNVKQELNKD
jgi:transcription antitermination protein NusB